MNLLILGAGGHGRVVKETVEANGAFDSIAFLDDHNSDTIRRLEDNESFRDLFDSTFVEISDNGIIIK